MIYILGRRSSYLGVLFLKIVNIRTAKSNRKLFPEQKLLKTSVVTVVLYCQQFGWWKWQVWHSVKCSPTVFPTQLAPLNLHKPL